MFQLVYVSTASNPLSTDELADLLHQFQAQNLRHGITGLLLYKQGAFMQALEGEEADVRTLYANILRDPRHGHVRTLLELPLPERQFPDWSMGFRNLDEGGLAATSAENKWTEAPPADDEMSWMASAAKGLLATFKKES